MVDKNIMKIRPYISGFVAKNVRIDEEFLRSIIQLQEKLSENFGKKRKKLSIGIYNHDKISFPVHYKLVSPELKFVPLDFDKPHSLGEILEHHTKGIEYGHIIKHHDLFPIFIDSTEQVLSFPPIINSNYIGRVETGTRNLFVEVTGTDQKAVLLTANIIAYAFADRGHKLESVETCYPIKTKYGKCVSAPFSFNASYTFKKGLVQSVLGISLGDKQIKSLLEKMQYSVKISGKNITVQIPDYRNDVMHSNDVIEDIGIAYGYSNIPHEDVGFFTLGSVSSMTEFSEKLKNIMIGLGFQEIMSPVLSSKKNLEEKMCTSMDSIEIENIMSENYSAVRSWLMPSLMNFLSKNMHIDYPQFIFEIGECATKSSEPVTKTKLACAIIGPNIGYQNISSVADTLLKQLGIKHKFVKLNHSAFIEGRTASIVVNNPVGILGELHPVVINNWGLDKAVVAFEIDADEIYKSYSKN